MEDLYACEISRIFSSYFIQRTKGSLVDIDGPLQDLKERNHTKRQLLGHVKEIVDEQVRDDLRGWPIRDEHSSDGLVVVMHDCE